MKKILFRFTLIIISIFSLQQISPAVSLENYVLNEDDLPDGWTIESHQKTNLDGDTPYFTLLEYIGVTRDGYKEILVNCGYVESYHTQINIPGGDGITTLEYRRYENKAGARFALDEEIRLYKLFREKEGGCEIEQLGKYGGGGLKITLPYDNSCEIIVCMKDILYFVTSQGSRAVENAETLSRIIDEKRKGFPSPQDIFEKAAGFYSEARYEEAIELFREYQRYYPNDKQGYEYLGRCYASLSLWASAAEEYETASRLSSGMAEKTAYYCQIINWCKIGNILKQEKAALQKLVEEFRPRDEFCAPFYIDLIKFYNADGEFDKAVELTAFAKELFPVDPGVEEIAVLIREKIAQAAGEKEEKILARQYLQQAIDAYSDGDYSRAQEYAGEAYNIDWENPEPHYWYAKSCLMLKNFEFARESFKRAAEYADEQQKKEAIIEELAEIDRLEKEFSSPQLQVEILKDVIYLESGETAELKSWISVGNTGRDAAKDVMLDLREAKDAAAELSVSDYLFVADVIKGSFSKEPQNKIFVVAKEAGEAELKIKAVCGNGAPSEEKILKVIVELPKTGKIPEVSDRVSRDGEPVQQVIAEETTKKAEAKKRNCREIKNKGWTLTPGNGRFSVLIKDGVFEEDSELFSVVGTPIKIEVQIHHWGRSWDVLEKNPYSTKQMALVFQPISVVDITNPEYPREANVISSTPSWLVVNSPFPWDWLVRTAAAYAFQIPMSQFCSKVVTGSPAKWDIIIAENEEWILAGSVTPREKGRIKIAWDYPYSFDDYIRASRSYGEYEHFKGEMIINVLDEKCGLK